MSDSIQTGTDSIQIGANILPYRTTTVELKMDSIQADLYRGVYSEQQTKLGAGKDSQGQQGRINHAVHATLRRLCHAGLNPELDKFAKVQHNVRNVNQWFESKDKDYGASVFHMRTLATIANTRGLNSGIRSLATVAACPVAAIHCFPRQKHSLLFNSVTK